MATAFEVERAPRPLSAYVHAKRAGNMLFLSGCGPRIPATNQVPGGSLVTPEGAPAEYDITAQTHQVFDNIELILKDSGAGLLDIVDIQSFLVDLPRNFKHYNAVYEERMRGVKSTRTTMYVVEHVSTATHAPGQVDQYYVCD